MVLSDFQSRRAKRNGTKRIEWKGNGNEIGIGNLFRINSDNNTIRTMKKTKSEQCERAAQSKRAKPENRAFKVLSERLSLSPRKATTTTSTDSDSDTFKIVCHRSLLKFRFCLYSCFASVLFLFRLLFWFFYNANVGRIVRHFVLLVKHVFQQAKINGTNISETATIP